MSGGTAEQEPLWGVAHTHLPAGTNSTSRVRQVNNLYVANSEVCVACFMASGRNCRVVTSTDGGRSWQPAGEDKP